MITRQWSLVCAFLVTVMLAMFSAGPVLARTSEKEEIELGRKTAIEVEKEYPLTDNKEWSAEIDKLGKSLTPYVKRKNLPYSFKIIKEKVDGENQVDAFSLPGGPVYMSERLWRILTRDERLGVLAHEIAHVDKRHAIDTMSEMQRRNLWSTAILIVTGAPDNILNAAGLANQLYTLKFSRKRETEADMTSVDLCRMSGANPAGIVTAMKKLLRIEQESGDSSVKILSTHPQTQDRVVYLTKRCEELGLKPDDLEVKYKDQPDRIGDVVSKAKGSKSDKVLNVSTIRPLSLGESIWIKKPLWDDSANAVVPVLVAKGKALTTGNKAQIRIVMEQDFEYADIESGDGIYPAPLPKVPSPPVFNAGVVNTVPAGPPTPANLPAQTTTQPKPK